MTTQGEFGALATINVKAYAAYLALEEQIRSLWPAAPAACAGQERSRPACRCTSW